MIIQLMTIDGALHMSDEITVDAGEEADTLVALENIRQSDGLWFSIKGSLRYFNPENVIWAEII